MASIADLDTKRGELDAAIAAYTQAVQDLAAGTATQTDVDNAKAAAVAKGDEYAKLAGQVKKDNPSLAEDDFFRNPTRQTAAIRDNVRTIMRTGMLFSNAMVMLIDTEGNTADATNMTQMFYNATAFDQDISMWGVSNVDTYGMFAINSPIDGTAKMPNFV